MKTKIMVLVLAVLATALGVTLWVTRQRAAEQHREDVETILFHSNKWVVAQDNFEKELQTSASLHRDLDKLQAQYNDLTNQFTKTVEKLVATEATLASTTASLKSAQETIAQRDARIATLESQNNELDQQAAQLSAAITNLTQQIEETRRKLAAAEGDRAFLEKELKRLMAEKADLERQFNDLKVLRAQVAKLKEELNIARRIGWLRQGLRPAGEQKGATLLLQGPNAPGQRPPSPHYDLNVEVSSDGTVRVIPPLTNAPAVANPPPR